MSPRNSFLPRDVRSIGIDEAGLGPILGPFCAAAVCFDGGGRTPELPAPWRRAFLDPSGPLPVADSKLVFRGPRGHARGEVAALSALACGAPLGPLFALDGAALLARASVDRRELLASAPWYADFAARLPRWASAEELDAARTVLEGGPGAAGARWRRVIARCVPEVTFNRSLARWENKADAAWEFVGGLLAEALADPEPPAFDVRIDRQGGRRFYAERLLELLPAWSLETIDETSERSIYVLVERATGRSARLWLESRAEGASFAVALASLVAKYLRELAMAAFNEWFGRLAPLVRATAGYPEDGRRWLLEMAPHLQASEISAAALLRQR